MQYSKSKANRFLTALSVVQSCSRVDEPSSDHRGAEGDDTACSIRQQQKVAKSKTSSRTNARWQSGKAEDGTGISQPQAQTRIEQVLHAWRLSEAKRRNIPTFRSFSDRALRGAPKTLQSRAKMRARNLSSVCRCELIRTLSFRESDPVTLCQLLPHHRQTVFLAEQPERSNCPARAERP